MANNPSERWPADKARAVIDLLCGTPIEQVSRQYGVDEALLRAWRAEALQLGAQSLEARAPAEGTERPSRVAALEGQAQRLRQELAEAERLRRLVRRRRDGAAESTK